MPQVLARTPRDRDSNMELLRVVSMLLVLVVHAGFRALSVPTPAEAVSAPGSTLLRFFSESASIICVNVFVLLSGWYGIRFRLLVCEVLSRALPLCSRAQRLCRARSAFRFPAVPGQFLSVSDRLWLADALGSRLY